MTASSSPKVLIFGAGSIGRSFIAPVFADGGWEVILADAAAPIIAALRSRNTFDVVYKSDAGESRRMVGPVRGADARDPEAMRRVIGESDLCVSCVGARSLPQVLTAIAEAVRTRSRPLDIILAENLKGASDFARRCLREAGLSEEALQTRIGLVETCIGKMVPSMPAAIAAADPLLCWAEPFNTLIVDADGFIGPIPKAPDLQALSPIAPWTARKLYVHNFGHAAAAYLGHRAHPEATLICDLLNDPEIAAATAEAMQVAGSALELEYPGAYASQPMSEYSADLLCRSGNHSLGDTVYRVGRDLRRKLHRADRVVGPLDLVRKHHLGVEAPLNVFRAALTFAAPKPDGSADEADAATRAAAADPESFLRDVVQTDSAAEAELTNLLRGVLREHN